MLTRVAEPAFLLAGFLRETRRSKERLTRGGMDIGLLDGLRYRMSDGVAYGQTKEFSPSLNHSLEAIDPKLVRR
jgi:hypothetical protein